MINDVKVLRSVVFSEVIIFEPSFHLDERGDIYTSYLKDIYDSYLPKGLTFIHDKFATSKKNVLRGLHGDSKTWKLVSCVFGEIFEVIVDYRENSKTYMYWDAWILSNNNRKSILIPPGFLNGYCVLSDIAVFHYKLAYNGEYIDSDKQFTLKWNDPRLNISWPCNNPILQNRDK